MEPKYLSPEKVSELLSIPRRTVLKMVREGRLEAFDFSGKIRIDHKSLNKAIEAAKISNE